MRRSKKNRVRPEPVDWQSRLDEIDPDEFQRIKDSATFVDFTKRSDGKRVGWTIHTHAELFFYLKYREFRDLSFPATVRLIAAAAQGNDFKFFIRLGSLLSSKTDQLKETYSAFSKLDKFLWKNWIKGRTQHDPPLCLFTGRALGDYLSYLRVLGANNKSEKYLLKEIKRLGLIKVDPAVIREVKLTPKGILFF